MFMCRGRRRLFFQKSGCIRCINAEAFSNVMFCVLFYGPEFYRRHSDLLTRSYCDKTVQLVMLVYFWSREAGPLNHIPQKQSACVLHDVDGATLRSVWQRTFLVSQWGSKLLHSLQNITRWTSFQRIKDLTLSSLGTHRQTCGRCQNVTPSANTGGKNVTFTRQSCGMLERGQVKLKLTSCSNDHWVDWASSTDAKFSLWSNEAGRVKLGEVMGLVLMLGQPL